MSKEVLRLSAHNLREFDRCPRAFALQYKANRFWPAPDPVPSKHMELGQAFHRIVHQKFLGLNPLIENLNSPDLKALWQKYTLSPYSGSEEKSRVWSEQNLHVTLDGVGFLARFDRLVRNEGNWTILDWKTGKIDPVKLAGDWQTKLYPFILAEAGSVLNDGEEIEPSKIRMIYWEGSTGISHDRFSYDEGKHEVLRSEFEEKVRQVSKPFDEEKADDPNFPRNPKHCKKCGYDSLCNRLSSSNSDRPELPHPRFV